MTSRLADNAFKWNPKLKAFTTGGRALAGLHPTLKATFYSHYSYDAAKLGPNMKQPHGSQSTKITKFRPGMAAGRLLDREMTRSIKLCTQYHLYPKFFYDKPTLTQYIKDNHHGLSAKDKKAINVNWSIATKRIWKALDALELTPISSQVPVGNLYMKVATAVDILCRNITGAHVVVELKCGFQNSYYKHTGSNLTGLTGNIPDSQANQHQLQLLVTHACYKTTFPSQRVASPLLLRVDSFGVDVVPLQDIFIKQAPLIYNMIALRLKSSHQ